MENFIKNKCSEITYAFAETATLGSRISLTFNIDTTKLNPNYANQINITTDGDFVEMFKELKAYEDLPALYFFRVNPEIDPNEIIGAIDEVNNTDNLNTPAKNKYTENKGMLYVGKVKSCAWGRLIQHLGYHQNKKSHGLQIDHWVKKISTPLNLTYTVIFFEKKMADYVQILEVAFAEEYKPIIGKH